MFILTSNCCLRLSKQEHSCSKPSLILEWYKDTCINEICNNEIKYHQHNGYTCCGSLQFLDTCITYILYVNWRAPNTGLKYDRHSGHLNKSDWLSSLARPLLPSMYACKRWRKLSNKLHKLLFAKDFPLLLKAAKILWSCAWNLNQNKTDSTRIGADQFSDVTTNWSSISPVFGRKVTLCLSFQRLCSSVRSTISGCLKKWTPCLLNGYQRSSFPSTGGDISPVEIVRELSRL